MSHKNKKNPEISIVIPLFDEEESLRELHERVSAVLKSMGRPAEIVFVDDGSTDNSMAVLTELHQLDPCVRVYQFRKNNGKSAALATGFSRDRAAGRDLPYPGWIGPVPASPVQPPASKSIGSSLARSGPACWA